MANRSIMEIITVFDGEQDAMDVFVELIARKGFRSKQNALSEKYQQCELTKCQENDILKTPTSDTKLPLSNALKNAG